MLKPCIEQFEMPAGDRGSNRIGAGLDAVGEKVVGGAAQSVDALHQHAMRAGAFDLGAHRDEAECEIGNLRLARCVENFGLAARQGRGHQRSFSRAH